MYKLPTPLLRRMWYIADLNDTLYDTKESKHVVEDLFPKDGDVNVDFMPKLRTLTIDGRNFQRAFFASSRWLDQQDELEVLEIAEYEPRLCEGWSLSAEHSCHECELPLYVLLDKVESFNSLAHLRIQHLKLSIAPDVISELFRLCSFTSDGHSLLMLEFNRCPNLHEIGTIPSVPITYLRKLDANVSLEPLLRDWDGHALMFNKVESDDTFLNMLMSTNHPLDWFVAPQLTALDLHSCSNITVSALRKLVNTRSSYVDFDDPDWQNTTDFGPALLKFAVLAGPGAALELSAEDEKMRTHSLIRLFQSSSSAMESITYTFFADAALFDMDGTLTDSIAAVEAAWDKVAKDIGQDPEHVIAATHGKRAVDNLSHFKPHLKYEDLEDEVAQFEESILFFADAYNIHGPGSEPGSGSISPLSDSLLDKSLSPPSDETTPELTPANSIPHSRRPSVVASQPTGRRPSFGSRLFHMLSVAARMRVAAPEDSVRVVGPDDGLISSLPEVPEEKVRKDTLEAWQLEAASVDRSAVATSGAKTYAYGCMNRVGITPPPVTITADDKRLKAGKPAPDPFLLAAECLGFDATRCVVFEDSPSGIRAGVASGATVIAICTSHERSQIENCGAHYIVENLESVGCEVVDGQLKFTVMA
ncbi:hypothetical protein NLJ89_g586 [Agrocybe chaxingu]|uniref:Uncharacterized protein n=1 Tax=Agrocybe chaxingu TaxID=84603 RepID=A0A9W8N1P7_9AGAR|nr:hypothetical protein NLJ89_g586 [Agrocybe chaxingu]